MVFNKNVMSLKNNELDSFLCKHNQRCHWTWSLPPQVNNNLSQINFIRISPLHPQQCLYCSLFLLLLPENSPLFLSLALPLTFGRA